MKKQIFFWSLALFLSAGAITITSCTSNSKKTNTEVSQETAEYACPMKCEGDKTYSEPGKCPKCGMDLKKVENHKEHKH